MQNCRFLADRICSITKTGCHFWANEEFQEHCETRVVRTIRRFEGGGTKPLHNHGGCSLVYPKVCIFAEEPALQGVCQEVMEAAWRMCEEKQSAGQRSGKPAPRLKGAAERVLDWKRKPPAPGQR